MPEPTCSEDGCEDPAKTKGFCKPHYDKQYYQRNRARQRAKQREWYLRNAEAVKAKAKAAYHADPEAKKAKVREYQKKDPERWAAYWARRYAENREAQAAAAKAWYQQNRAYAIQRAKEYAAAHPEQARSAKRRYKKSERGRLVDLANVHARIARKKNAPGRASVEQLEGRWAYYDGLCWMCGDPANEWDHVIPLAGGGSNWPSNLRPACRHCNSRKSDRPFGGSAEATLAAPSLRVGRLRRDPTSV